MTKDEAGEAAGCSNSDQSIDQRIHRSTGPDASVANREPRQSRPQHRARHAPARHRQNWWFVV